jgi:hypothetical protein
MLKSEYAYAYLCWDVIHEGHFDQVGRRAGLLLSALFCAHTASRLQDRSWDITGEQIQTMHV